MWSFRRRFAFAALALASALSHPALALQIESSCPDPCDTPPKYALFMRHADAQLSLIGTFEQLMQGTLQKGLKKTVVRFSTHWVSSGSPVLLGRVGMYVYLNNHVVSPFLAVPCSAAPGPCTIEATFWADIDALEAKYPGEFIGKPLEVRAGGGSDNDINAQDQPYELSLSVEVVKKK